MVTLLLVILNVILLVKYITYKISAEAIAMYIKDNGMIPDENTINVYVRKAANKLLHISD